mmetsp:Transcript_3194/g.6035  ORF Transcript_3194/g.6035 Transcript_3194/m.6035 type:complete len:269 (+) Transcript_3194:92-898(+)
MVCNGCNGGNDAALCALPFASSCTPSLLLCRPVSGLLAVSCILCASALRLFFSMLASLPPSFSLSAALRRLLPLSSRPQFLSSRSPSGRLRLLASSSSARRGSLHVSLAHSRLCLRSRAPHLRRVLDRKRSPRLDHPAPSRWRRSSRSAGILRRRMSSSDISCLRRSPWWRGLGCSASSLRRFRSNLRFARPSPLSSSSRRSFSLSSFRLRLQGSSSLADPRSRVFLDLPSLSLLRLRSGSSLRHASSSPSSFRLALSCLSDLPRFSG